MAASMPADTANVQVIVHLMFAVVTGWCNLSTGNNATTEIASPATAAPLSALKKPSLLYDDFVKPAELGPLIEGTFQTPMHFAFVSRHSRGAGILVNPTVAAPERFPPVRE